MTRLAETMRLCAVIPARSGSSFSNKNIQQLHDCNLIERAIRVAISCVNPKDVFLSSDSKEYLELGKPFGIRLHNRPAWAASDTAVAQDVLDSIPQLVDYSALAYLQPTSPLRTSRNFRESIQLFTNNPFNEIVSVTDVRQYPSKMLVIANDGTLRDAFQTSGTYQNRNPEELKYVYPNGAIYLIPKGKDNKFTFGSAARLPFRMSQLESIDVDTPEDLWTAKVILHAQRN